MGYYYDNETRERGYYCDECKAPEYEALYEYENKELCWECYVSKFDSKICDDMDDTRCAYCGKEAEELFNVDGEWLCFECFHEVAESVKVEVE